MKALGLALVLIVFLAAACARSPAAPVASSPIAAAAAPPAPAESSASSPPPPPPIDAPFREHEPAADAEKPFVVPAPEHAQLRGGIPVLVVGDPSPFVALYVLARGGEADVGPDHVEVLKRMAAMLTKGTTNETVWALDDVYTALYMPRPYVFWWADAVVLKIVGPADKIRELVGLAADFVLHPSFDQKELDRTREMQAGSYEHDATNGAVLAPRILRRAMFGRHAYAAVDGSPARLRAVTRAEVTALHARVFDPSRLSIVVSGAAHAKDTVDALDDAFGALKAKPSARAGIAPPAPQPSGPRVVVVDLPGSAIADIAMGVPAPTAGAGDAEAAMIALQVLADGGMGRLGTRLRTEMGAVPWVSASAYQARAGGILGWNTRAPTERVATVLTEAARVVRTLATEGPADHELAWARDREVYSFASSFETSASAASLFASAVATGQTAEWVAQRPQRFAALTADAVKAAAARYLDADKVRTVVVGDWAALREPLTALGWGPVEVRRPDGTVVPPEGARHAAR
jgi:zinc protease